MCGSTPSVPTPPPPPPPAKAPTPNIPTPNIPTPNIPTPPPPPTVNIPTPNIPTPNIPTPNMDSVNDVITDPVGVTQEAAGKATGLGDPNPNPLGKPNNDPLGIGNPFKDSNIFGGQTVNPNAGTDIVQAIAQAFAPLGGSVSISNSGVDQFSQGQNVSKGTKGRAGIRKRRSLSLSSTGKGAASKNSDIKRSGLQIRT